mgnify:CR=1 FL=1
MGQRNKIEDKDQVFKAEDTKGLDSNSFTYKQYYSPMYDLRTSPMELGGLHRGKKCPLTMHLNKLKRQTYNSVPHAL